jgi:hypothetical protein
VRTEAALNVACVLRWRQQSREEDRFKVKKFILSKDV